MARPVSISVNTYGTNAIPEEAIVKLIEKNFSPDSGLSIIKSLDLRRPIYKQTAAYGHFRPDGCGSALGTAG